MKSALEIGCFISPHGLGHATRVCAILEALTRRTGSLSPHIFTTVPQSIFRESLSQFHFHPVKTDIGLIQRDSLHADLEKTVSQLDKLLPYSQSLVDRLAKKCRDFSFILCDISPLGILVAKHAGIPSILVENFTWDWIYQPYISQNSRMNQFSSYFGQLFHQADYHIQTEPVCCRSRADLLCGPIYRTFRTDSRTIRSRLNCNDRKMVFISMGGIGVELPFLEQLEKFADIVFVIGSQQQSEKIAGNCILLDHGSGYYHPDLIHAADLVLCKTGYSTVAECYQTSNTIAGVSRKVFPESTVLEAFIRHEMNGTIIDPDDFLSGKWLAQLDDLLGRPSRKAKKENGADEVAVFLLQLF